MMTQTRQSKGNCRA